MAVRPVARRRGTLTPRRVTLLLILFLVALQGLVALSAPHWSRLLRRPVAPLAEEEEGAPATPRPGTPPGPDAERTISVKLFFEGPERSGLVMEERTVVYRTDLADQLRAVIEELFRGSQAWLVSPLAPEAKVLEVFVTAGGCAYVDLARTTIPALGSGSQAELHAVYAIVNSLVVNFPAVTRVQLLVDDRVADTFAGHLDLSKPLRGDLTLLAPADVTAEASPAETGAGGAPPPEPTAAPATSAGAAPPTTQ
jgi:hypothetical protein